MNHRTENRYGEKVELTQEEVGLEIWSIIGVCITDKFVSWILGRTQ